MKFVSIALVLLSFASCRSTQANNADSSVESAKVGSKISVPGEDIFAAIQKIQKLQPARVQVLTGTLACEINSREFPPYGATSECSITANGKKQMVDHADEIVAALQKAKPATGPHASWTGAYEVRVVAGDFPPYKSDIMATVVLK